MIPSYLVIGALSLLLIERSIQSPITIPLKPGGDLDKVIPEYFDTKRFKNYHKMSPLKNNGVREVDVTHDMFSCNIDLKLRWSTMVGSPVFTAPVAFANGKQNEKQIYISTYYQYIESLSHDGSKSWGWPLSMEDSSFQASPLIYDIDGDGNTDIGVVDKNGNLFWIRTGEFGEYLEDYHITIPKLRIRRDWFEGLDPNVMDSNVRLSMFDRTSNSLRHRDARRPESDLPDPPGYQPGPKTKIDDLKAPKRKVAASAKTPREDGRPSRVNRKAPAGPPALGSASKTTSGTGSRGGDVGGRRLTAVDAPLVDVDQRPPSDAAAPEMHEAELGTPPEVKPADVVPVKSAPTDTEPQQPQQQTQSLHQELKEEQQKQQLDSLAKEQEEGLPADLLSDPLSDFTEGLSIEDQARFMHGDDDYAVQMRMHQTYSPQEDWTQGANADADAPDSPDIPKDEEEEPVRVEDIANGDPNSNMEEPEMPIHYGYAARNARRFDYGPNYYAANQMYGGGVTSGNDSKYILIDSHILATPVLSDVNRDGHMEIIFAVSYYFDKMEYENKPGLNFDPENYVAGGIVAWDMENQDWSWMVHLDLTTSKSEFQALIYATPTVADLDGDGKYEVIVGTSLGLLYILDGESGFVRRYFPMQFHSIQAQVAVGDVLGGRDLEIIVADMGGTVAVVNVNGDVLWDVQLTGTLPFTPTLGDVNGDGKIDIVVATVAPDGCHIYVLEGDTGETLEGYPVALPEKAQVTSSVLLVDLNPRTSQGRFEHGFDPHVSNTTTLRKSKHNPLSLVVTSFDGHVYILGKARSMFGSGNLTMLMQEHPCAQRIDVGEHIYSQPLIDDIDGDGFLDFLIGTMNGQVMLFESAVPSSVLNSWNSFPKNRLNGFTHADKGIMISPAEKNRLKLLDIHGGHELEIKFEIYDSRYGFSFFGVRERDQGVKYTVQVTKGSNKVEPLWKGDFEAPGVFSLKLPVNPPETSVFVVSMVDEHGQYFEDTVYVSLSTKFYVWLKYMVVTPIVILCTPLLLRFFKYL